MTIRTSAGSTPWCLHHAGYHVDTAEDGAFAWEALGTSRYDLMITDNNMPNLTGMELLKKLYASRMAMPFIMATGKLPEEEFARYPWLRPAATLLKPYTVEELLGAVKKVLRETDDDDAAAGFELFRSQDLKANKVPQTGELASAPVQSRKSPLRRILVVEDEPDIRRLNAEVLESSGYEVDTAEDGLAGWKVLHAARHAPESYALLITDHDMPGLSGLALVKKARAARMALPVIMATGTLPTEELFTRYPWLQPAADAGQALFHRAVVGDGGKSSARDCQPRRGDCAAAKRAVRRWLAVMMIPVPTPASSEGSSGLDTWAGLDSSCRTKFLNHGGPVPLWLKARIQAIGFRRGDLERTHWKKVWRSMFVD